MAIADVGHSAPVVRCPARVVFEAVVPREAKLNIFDSGRCMCTEVWCALRSAGSAIVSNSATTSVRVICFMGT